MRGKRKAVSRRAVLGAALGAAPAAWAKRKRPDPRYHVLFIGIDDLRPALGCYGDTLAHSQNIDLLAHQGLTFRRTYCQQAADAPSRTSVLTGLRPNSTGIHTEYPERDIPLRVPPVAYHFRTHGYTIREFGTLFTERDTGYPENADETAIHNAVKAINGHRSGRLFLSVGLRGAHGFRAPAEHQTRFAGVDVPLAGYTEAPEQAPAYVMHNSPELSREPGVPTERPVDPTEAQQLIRGYYASISYTDELVGKLLSALGARGLLRDTAIVLWGDSGFHLGEHGLWGKRTNFEAATHTPLIVSFPDQKGRGRRTSALTELVDIYPSLCNICQVPAPQLLEGSSFAPVFLNPDRLWKRAVFSQYPRNIPFIGEGTGYSMRTKRYRYTEWVVPEQQFKGVEVYDYYADPDERRNIALRPQNLSLVNGLAGMLQEGWRESLPPTHRITP